MDSATALVGEDTEPDAALVLRFSLIVQSFVLVALVEAVEVREAYARMLVLQNFAR